MTYSKQSLAVMVAQNYNILPITSACNLNCIFCSHQGNPPEVKTFAQGHRSFTEIKELISFLHSGQKIVIGESLTKIQEGEPFIHPQFKAIIKELQTRFPETLIKLTTNGTRLTPANLNLLAAAKPVEVNVSLNSASPAKRKKLMGAWAAETVLEGIKGLQQREIPYHGSIVAMPQVVGWSDLEATIAYLDQYGAQTIRVFLPGYTRDSPEEIKFELSLWRELEEFITNLQEKYSTPITLEPARIKSLRAYLEGVIADSPAAKAGLQPNDELITINQDPVFSRVDAFKRLLKSGDPVVEINRCGTNKTVTVAKAPEEKSGVVVDYDVDPSLLVQVNRIINSAQAQRILILTSILAEKRLKRAFSFLPADKDWELQSVANNFFGGSIMSAGLLTVNDFRRALQNYSGAVSEIDLVLLPAAAFDFFGQDVIGKHYRQLEEEFKLDLEIIG